MFQPFSYAQGSTQDFLNPDTCSAILRSLHISDPNQKIHYPRLLPPQHTETSLSITISHGYTDHQHIPEVERVQNRQALLVTSQLCHLGLLPCGQALLDPSIHLYSQTSPYCSHISSKQAYSHQAKPVVVDLLIQESRITYDKT